MKKTSRGKYLLKFGVLCSSLTMMLFFGGTVLGAQETVSIEYDLDGGVVSIKGTAENDAKYAALEILKKDKTEDDVLISDESKLGDVIMHADQVSVADDGGFEFLFALPRETETYDYAARVSFGKVENGVLVYISHSDFLEAMGLINSPETDNKSAMYDAIEKAKLYIGINAEEYDKLEKTEKINIAETVLAERNLKTDKVFPDSNSFLQAFTPQFIIQKINHAGGEDKDFDEEELIWSNQELFEFSKLPAYKTYNALDEDIKASITQAVCERDDYKEISEIQDEFSFRTINYALYKAAGHDEVENILNQNKEFLDISMSDYNDLSSKSSVNKKMIGKEFSSAEDIKKTFEELVKNASKKGSSGGSSGGSGGGSGSSGAANIILSDSIAVDKDEIFNDLDEAAWAKESITELYKMGVVNGKGQGKFAPSELVTREEFAKMLTLVLDCVDSNASCNFKDVKSGSWYYSYVASGVNAGLIKGISEESFGTGANISRQDIGVLISRAASFAGVTLANTKTADFADYADISDYAREAVEAISGAGLVGGTAEGNFEPKRGATRAETAKILYGFVKLLG